MVASSVGAIFAVSPTVAVTATPNSGTLPLKFTSAGTDSSGQAVTDWFWTFGEDKTSTLQNPSRISITGMIVRVTATCTVGERSPC